jgi:hypothetical protein
VIGFSWSGICDASFNCIAVSRASVDRAAMRVLDRLVAAC